MNSNLFEHFCQASILFQVMQPMNLFPGVYFLQWLLIQEYKGNINCHNLFTQVEPLAWTYSPGNEEIKVHIHIFSEQVANHRDDKI